MNVFYRKGFWLLLLLQSPVHFFLVPLIWKNGFDPFSGGLCTGLLFATYAIFWLDTPYAKKR